MPTNARLLKRPLKTSPSPKFERESFKKVDGLRKSRIAKGEGIISSKGKVKKKRLSPRRRNQNVSNLHSGRAERRGSKRSSPLAFGSIAFPFNLIPESNKSGAPFLELMPALT